MDRRLVLLLLNAALAVILGFFTLTPEQSLQAVIQGGYWAMLLLTVLFGWSLFKVGRAALAGGIDWRNRPRWPVALIIACGLLLLVHETYGFKILMDEVMLLGTSMNMHIDKTVLVPMRGNDIQGAFQLLAGQLDKRPLFQPFLVSVLHDLTGYRPENVFVLNTALTFVLLALSYVTGCRIGGRGAGAIAVLLLTSLPLLAQNATGGGFELLNLVMILATLLLGMRYLERRDGDSLEAFGLAGILLAQTRYESVLYLLPVGLTVLWIWWNERRPTLTWVVVAMPLMLLPYALHNKVFSVRTSAWEMASQPGYDKPFSLSFIPDNIAHDLNFFFNTTGEHSNSLVLSILGFLALPFFVLWTVKTLRSLRTATPAHAGLAIFALGFAAHTLLLLCYFWGRFDDPVIRRLSLPLNLTLALAVVTVATEFSWQGRIWRVLAVLVGVGFFAHSLPAMARHDYSLDYYVGREMEWRREFIAAHPERDYLFIDNNSIIWITHEVSSTPVLQALEHKENIIFNLRNRTFTAIYVFQRFLVEPDSGHLTLPVEDDLGADYQLETVWERRFTPLTVSRISRVLTVREGPTARPVAAPKPLESLTPAEQEKAREQFLQRFIKRLP
ncbi:MAG: glycosyltransferase family 39 protein [Lacunisphaera sp.]|nr:glycosyltransferase family 39 protein [Lacunisphaera sp.]